MHSNKSLKPQKGVTSSKRATFKNANLLQQTSDKQFYTANVCRDLQGLCRGFLQYLQGKSCNIYRFSLQYLQIAEIAGKTCKYYMIFPADIAENPCRVPVNPCKHLECGKGIKV